MKYQNEHVNKGDVVKIVRNIPIPGFQDNLNEGYTKSKRQTSGKILRSLGNGWIVQVEDHEFFFDRKDFEISVAKTTEIKT